MKTVRKKESSGTPFSDKQTLNPSPQYVDCTCESQSISSDLSSLITAHPCHLWPRPPHPTLPTPPSGGRSPMRKHARAHTCPQIHVHWPKLIRRVPDAQLAGCVAAPALDGAPGHERARMESSQADGGGGDAWACARVHVNQVPSAARSSYSRRALRALAHLDLICMCGYELAIVIG